MIRPITCVTFLLACGSGLYLYQTKHKVHVLDAQIDQVVHQTAQVREQTRVLRAEWTLLDQPDRLQQLAAQFLTLQPTKPSQFVSAADLDSRLPAPLPPHSATPPPPAVEDLPAGASLVASAAPPGAPEPAPVADNPADHPASHAEPSHATLVAIRTPPDEAASPRPAAHRLEAPRPAAPRLVAVAVARPIPVYRPPYQRYSPRQAPPAAVPAAAPVYGGSMLGMAHTAAAPPPPTPAPVWINWNR
ncbi:MAG TPA: hypothetical protein VIJ55_07315 [Acetobacteraceae bacterium]